MNKHYPWYINQTVYIENKSGVESFCQSICLQYYERDEIFMLLNKCGFIMKQEYSNQLKEPWKNGDECWIVEVIKPDCILKSKHNVDDNITLNQLIKN